MPEPCDTPDFFRPRLAEMIDLRHPLAVLASRLPWSQEEQAVCAARPGSRQAIEPAIGHTNHDNGTDRCWLKGQTGDALHAVLCAAGHNIRWLLRAMTRLGLRGLFLRLLALTALIARASNGSAFEVNRGGLQLPRAQG